MTPIAKNGRIVVCGLLLIVAAGCAGGQGSVPASATPEEAAQRVAELAVQLGSYERAMDNGTELAWQSSVETLTLELGRELTAEEQTEVKRIFNTVLGEFLTAELWQESVERAYAKSFTAAELDAMFEFYSSPAGRKTLELEGAMADAVDDELQRKLDGELDAFIERIDGALGEAFPDLADEESAFSTWTWLGLV